MRRASNLVGRYPVLALALLALATFLTLTLLGQATVAKWIGTTAVLIVITVTAVSMIRDILRRHYGLDILALVAMIATLAVGEVLAALIIVLMLSGGEALEDYASNRASRELTSLIDRSPRSAHRVTAGSHDGETHIQEISVDEVRIGDKLVVRPSEIVPVNGVLLTPHASFDESSLTGESLPVTRVQGDVLRSGILNGESAVLMRATHVSADSEYQKILALVRQAHESKAPVVRLADRFAVPFTIVSLLIAGIAWAVAGDPLRFAQVLVLATPCPLLIAAPVAFLGGLSRSAKAGVVVKGGAALEKLAATRSVAFDKTGTLTLGEPVLVDVRPEAGFDEDTLLTLVASAEQYSSHVLAEGICEAARRRAISFLPASDAREEATNGVSATVEGRRVIVGKLSYVQRHAPAARQTEIHSGQLAAYVSVDGEFAGSVVLADKLRPDARWLVQWLRSTGVERIAILSGDAAETVDAVASDLRITETYGELLPTDKVRIMASLEPKPSVMVGDGVNDAPVLAAADVGIAMGARGATAAGEAADAVILKDSLTPVAHVLAISKHTLKVALQAIWIGIALSIGLMLVATTGVIPAVVGAFIQEIIDLVAIVYALRTLSGRLPEYEDVSGSTDATLPRSATDTCPERQEA